HSDFQGYAKPLRLLRASEPKLRTNGSSEEKPIRLLDTESLYRIKLQTSKNYGSDLTDMISGVSICVIDENGSSILQRLPAAFSGESFDIDMNKSLHFQRGSIDEFSFEGPNLGRIVAVWIGLESGQWRISGMNLTVQPQNNISSAENSRPGLCYQFEIDDILLGEKTEFSMMEFRPHSVATPDDESHPLPNPSNEERMKQYADLKFSLLLYDALLVLGGASFISVDDASYAAFLTGGVAGFIYLLLIQRWVDGLSVVVVPGEKKFNIFFPIVMLFAFLALLNKYYDPPYGSVVLRSEDIIFGMMGFVMCKVAVALASFKQI
ncbi:hypothetical protein M569_13041, partial [Genlisea aurea]